VRQVIKQQLKEVPVKINGGLERAICFVDPTQAGRPGADQCRS
jgi:hypothetical protein